MTVTGLIGWVCMFPLRLIISTCVALRIHPNILTFVGVLINAAAAWALAPWLLADRLIVRAAVMVALVAIGGVFFALFCHVTGVVDFRRVLAEVRPGKRGSV